MRLSGELANGTNHLGSDEHGDQRDGAELAGDRETRGGARPNRRPDGRPPCLDNAHRAIDREGDEKGCDHIKCTKVRELDVRHGQSDQRSAQQGCLVAIDAPPQEKDKHDRADVGEHRKHPPDDTDPGIVAILLQFDCPRLCLWDLFGQPRAQGGHSMSHQGMKVER